MTPEEYRRLQEKRMLLGIVAFNQVRDNPRYRHLTTAEVYWLLCVGAGVPS